MKKENQIRKKSNFFPGGHNSNLTLSYQSNKKGKNLLKNNNIDNIIFNPGFKEKISDNNIESAIKGIYIE